MKKLLLLITIFSIWGNWCFSQTNPVTTPPISPTQLNTASFYQEPATKKLFLYNGSTYLWRQLVDSIQAQRMINRFPVGTLFIKNQNVSPQNANFWINGQAQASAFYSENPSNTNEHTAQDFGSFTVFDSNYASYLGPNFYQVADRNSGDNLFYLSQGSTGNEIIGRKTTFRDTLRSSRVPVSATDVVRLQDLSNYAGLLTNNTFTGNQIFNSTSTAGGVNSTAINGNGISLNIDGTGGISVNDRTGSGNIAQLLPTGSQASSNTAQTQYRSDYIRRVTNIDGHDFFINYPTTTTSVHTAATFQDKSGTVAYLGDAVADTTALARKLLKYGETIATPPAGYGRLSLNANGSFVVNKASGNNRTWASTYPGAVTMTAPYKANSILADSTDIASNYQPKIGYTANNTSPPFNRNIVFYGSSLTAGIGNGGITTVAQTYPYQVATQAGYSYINNGVGSMSLQQLVAGDNSIFTIYLTIAAPVTSNDIIVIEPLVNDVISAGYDVSTFTTQLTTVVNRLTSIGWAANHIILYNPSYYYSTAKGQSDPEGRHTTYTTAMQGVATSLSTLYLDTWTNMKTAQGISPVYVYTDFIHMTPTGQTFAANLLTSFITTNFGSAVDYTITKSVAAGNLIVQNNVSVDNQLYARTIIGSGNISTIGRASAYSALIGQAPVTAINGSILNVSGGGVFSALSVGAGTKRFMNFTSTVTPTQNATINVAATFTATNNTGNGALTATASGTTTASDGTVTAQPTVTVTGNGSGATYTVTTVGNTATVITMVAAGDKYQIGDTFTIATLPGITFSVASLGYTGIRAYAAQFLGGPITLSSITAPVANSSGDFMNIGGVPKWFGTALNRVALQTDLAGTATTAPVYNASGQLVPTTVTGTGSPVLAASPTFTGTPSLPTGTIGVTQTAGNSTTALATTAFATTADNLKLNISDTTAQNANLVHKAINETITGVKTFSKTIASTPSDIVMISNPTAATVGQQQYSPGINLQGNAWGTTLAASQPSNIRIYNSVFSSTTSRGSLAIDFSNNGAAYGNRFMLSDAGGLTLNGGAGAIAAGAYTGSVSGFATTPTLGQIFQNNSAATAGAPVQYSPYTAWKGTVWNTTATAASNTVEFRTDVRAVSGTTPSFNYTWSSINNGGGSNAVMTLDNNGVLTPVSVAPSALVSSAPTILATVTGINTKTTGSTALYTVPAGKTLIVTGVYLKCTAATAITVGAQADVGVAAGSVYTNANIAMTTAVQSYSFPPGGVMTPPTTGQVLNLNINTAATGTSQTITAIVVGFLL